MMLGFMPYYTEMELLQLNRV